MPRAVRLSALVLGLGAVTLGTSARAQAPDEGHFVSAGGLQSLVTKTRDGLVTAPVPSGPGATILMVRRDRDGEVEVHERMNDEFVVETGHATVRVGGKVSGARQTGPGEWRGGSMSGGRAYQLSPGDVLWIPAGSPHQTLAPSDGSFSYLAFKFEAKPDPAAR